MKQPHLQELAHSAGGRRLAEMFAHLGRDLSHGRRLEDVLTTLTHRAVEVVPGAEHAAVTRSARGGFKTVAATSEVPPRVDRIQYELQTGPCVDAIKKDTAFRIADLGADPRWPEFGRRAVDEVGIRSMLSIRFFFEDVSLVAGLNLYASASRAFDDDDETRAMLLATHGALAVTAAQLHEKVDNLNIALLNSRRIGTSIGILMATYKVTDEQAFDLLRVASQTSHRKIAELAEEVNRTGTLDLPSLTR
jgi:GAF domain-containing protein